MKPKILGSLGLLLVLLILTGCSSHPRKVDCEAHLQPINAPQPKTPEGRP